MDEVWGNVVVAPNTLQRSIKLQLRKALGDNGKSYIKTHAKQGYSLDCEVSWHTQTVHSVSRDVSRLSSSTLDGTAESKLQKTVAIVHQVDSRRHSRILYGVILSTLFSMIIFSLVTIEHPQSLSFGELRALTATDHKEVGGSYTPDGQYAVFHRYSNAMCQNTLYAKHLVSQQEYQLTEATATYGGHSFSPDGKQLVMIQETDCTQPVTQKICYKLMKMDFSAGLKSPPVTSSDDGV